MENFFIDYKYLIVPFFVWLGLQILKVILYKCNTKEWNWHRITGAGGLISSHSAVKKHWNEITFICIKCNIYIYCNV